MPATQPPQQISPTSPGDYLEVMSKAVFQSGMSWRVIDAKWSDIREAFHSFDAEAVAGLSDDDIDDLAGDRRVIRNRRKLAAIVGNAGRLLELDAEHGSFRAYLRSHGDFSTTVTALRKDFKFLGEVGCYFFLYVVGEEVPPHEEFEASRRR